MADEPTWSGVAKGMLVLGVLWWAWVGYAWLTSVVDPEEGAVRLVIFAAMAALLVVALCVPGGVRRRGAAVRAAPTRSCALAQIVLFLLASRDDPALRRSVDRARRSARRSASACSSPRRSPTAGSRARCGRSRWRSTWAARCFFGVEGWKLVPGHFAERHGLIIIIALGESIVAIGVGAEGGVDAGRRRRRRARGRGRRGAVVAVLRRRRARRRAAAVERRARARAERDRARLLLATCTCRWSPASCCSRWG